MKLAVPAAALILFAACAPAAFAADPVPDVPAAAHAQGYVALAAGADLFEIQSSQLALQGSASGADFDKAYLQAQVTAHQAALAIHTGYAQRGDREALRQAAGAAVPIVQMHLDRVRMLAGA